MQAALSAAEQGARVLLFDENSALGGHLLMSSAGQDKLAELRSAVEANDKIDVATDTIVMGWFEDNWLYGVSGRRMYKIRGKSTIFATGAYDQPLLFDNNDLPGVMLGSAARRLLHMYGVAVGSRVVIITANEDGWQLAQELQNSGVEHRRPTWSKIVPSIWDRPLSRLKARNRYKARSWHQSMRAQVQTLAHTTL